MSNIELFNLILEQEESRLKDISLFVTLIKKRDELIKDMANVLQIHTEKLNELEGRIFAKEHTYK